LLSGTFTAFVGRYCEAVGGVIYKDNMCKYGLMRAEYVSQVVR